MTREQYPLHGDSRYRPQFTPPRERNIMLALALTWAQLGADRLTLSLYERTYLYACDFVDNHQRPASEYGIGEGKDMDWDEHVETWFKAASDLIDP